MEPELDWLTLDDDEDVVWSDTPHSASVVPALVIGLPLSVVLIGIPIIVSAYLSLRNTHYVVTTAGLYRKSGVFARDVQKVGFDKVQNTSYSQGILGSYVGFGNVDVSTAGGSGVEMQFRSVEGPREVAELVNRHVKRSAGSGDDAADKRAALDDVLTELRAIRSLLEDDGSTRSRRSESERVDVNTFDELAAESSNTDLTGGFGGTDAGDGPDDR